MPVVGQTEARWSRDERSHSMDYMCARWRTRDWKESLARRVRIPASHEIVSSSTNFARCAWTCGSVIVFGARAEHLLQSDGRLPDLEAGKLELRNGGMGCDQPHSARHREFENRRSAQTARQRAAGSDPEESTGFPGSQSQRKSVPHAFRSMGRNAPEGSRASCRFEDGGAHSKL